MHAVSAQSVSGSPWQAGCVEDAALQVWFAERLAGLLDCLHLCVPGGIRLTDYLGKTGAAWIGLLMGDVLAV